MTKLSKELAEIAFRLVPEPVLLTVTHMFERTLFEWATPPPGFDFQPSSNIVFVGNGSHLPIPYARFIVTPPDGRLMRHDEAVPGSPWNVDYQPQHAYIMWLGEEERPPLRNADFMGICLFFNQGSSIEIRVQRQHLHLSAQVIFVLNPSEVTRYPALCGALLWLLSSPHSPMLQIPVMFQDSEVLVRLARPTILVPNTPLPLARCIREAIALLMLRLQEPDVVPDARLQFQGPGGQFHDCALQQVLYD